MQGGILSGLSQELHEPDVQVRRGLLDDCTPVGIKRPIKPGGVFLLAELKQDTGISTLGRRRGSMRHMAVSTGVASVAPANSSREKSSLSHCSGLQHIRCLAPARGIQPRRLQRKDGRCCGDVIQKAVWIDASLRNVSAFTVVCKPCGSTCWRCGEGPGHSSREVFRKRVSVSATHRLAARFSASREQRRCSATVTAEDRHRQAEIPNIGRHWLDRRIHPRLIRHILNTRCRKVSREKVADPATRESTTASLAVHGPFGVSRDVDNRR